MMRQQEVLIIEDDLIFADSLVTTLKAASYAVRMAYSGQRGLEAVCQAIPDLILLDPQLPDISGCEILRRIRVFSSVPIIFVSSLETPQDRVTALEQGADDFFSRPIHPDELLARIGALLRRIRWNPAARSVLEAGILRLEVARRMLLVNGEPIALTAVEFAILKALVEQAGTPVACEQLVNTVWGPGSSSFAALRVNISRLRQKIEADPRHPILIQTVPGRGYLVPDSD
ncbi:MAG: response regulator transcription factor [Anaerolineae bacterium]|nr:response regulator transcription factor [Anaerolineae bacterium]